MSTSSNQLFGERFREMSFATLLVLGMLVFALGLAFLVIGVSVGTEPPAPYVTAGDKRLIIVSSVVGMVVGGALVRAAGKTVGW